LTEEEFINEFWGWCKGCHDGDTAHTVETEEMRKLFRQAISAERERCAKVAEDFRTLGGNRLTREYCQNIAEAIRGTEIKDKTV